MKSILFVITIIFTLNGCTVLSIADAVGSAVVGTTKAVAKGTVAVVGAVIPGGDDEEDEEENKEDDGEQ